MSTKPDKSKNNGFDLAELVEAQTADFTPKNPKTLEPIVSADETPWKMEMAGPSHPDAVKNKHLSIGRGLKRMRKGQDDVNAEVVERESIEYLVARTLNWNPINFGGETLEFSKDNTRMLFEKLDWLNNQVNQFLRADDSFLTSSANK